MSGPASWPPVTVGDIVELPSGSHFLGRRTVRLKIVAVPSRAKLLADAWVWVTAAPLLAGGAVTPPLPVLVRVADLRPLPADR